MSVDWKPSEAEWLQALEGSLSPQHQLRFQTWLDAHPAEARAFHDLQALEADLVLMPLPILDEAEMDRAHGRVMSAITQESEPRREVSFLPLRLRPWSWIPAAAAALVVGVLLGRQGTGTFATGGAPQGRASLAQVDGVVEASTASPSSRTLDVQDLAVDARSGVRIRLQETSNYEINGTTADEEVQNTLSYIVRNDREADRRLTAIQLLDKHCSGQEVCQVLVYAMTQDPVSQVRREAAMALQDDQQDAMVRQSFLKMMVEDPTPELRQLAEAALKEHDQAPAQPVGR